MELEIQEGKTMKCKLCQNEINDWNQVLPCPCGNIFCGNCRCQLVSKEVVKAIEGDVD